MEVGEVEKSFLRPIDNTSVVQQVIDRLTYAMIYKELRPGDKLPTEMELASSFGRAQFNSRGNKNFGVVRRA